MAPMVRQSTPPQFTLGRLLTFCLINKGPRLFRGWPPHHIAYVLAEAHHSKILHVTACDNHITGMVIARPIGENRLHIEHILCVTRESLARLLQKCRQVYPGYTLIYDRRGRRRQLSQEQLTRLSSYGF